MIMTDIEKIRAEIDRMRHVRKEACKHSFLTGKQRAEVALEYGLLGKVLDIIDHLPKEPVSEELLIAARRAAVDLPDTPLEFLCERPYSPRDEYKFIEGANWQKKNLWKDAQGDDLPEIDREVIALQGRKVVFAHRPNPEGWDGKSLDSGKVEHFEPQTYDKGGWNMPDITYWLDAPLPEGIE